MKKTASIVLAVLAILVIWFVIAPPRFVLNLIKPVDTTNLVASGAALVEQYQCTSCHQIKQEGRPFGPPLDGITNRMDGEKLHLWLAAPDKVKPGTAMPNLKLSDQEIDAIIAYLDSVN